MSNDRLFLVCDGCDEKYFLHKYYPNMKPTKLTKTGQLIEWYDGLYEFMEAHLKHHVHYGENHLHGIAGFHVESEVYDDKKGILDELSKSLGPITPKANLLSDLWRRCFLVEYRFNDDSEDEL